MPLLSWASLLSRAFACSSSWASEQFLIITIARCFYFLFLTPSHTARSCDVQAQHLETKFCGDLIKVKYAHHRVHSQSSFLVGFVTDGRSAFLGWLIFNPSPSGQVQTTIGFIVFWSFSFFIVFLVPDQLFIIFCPPRSPAKRSGALGSCPRMIWDAKSKQSSFSINF